MKKYIYTLLAICLFITLTACSTPPSADADSSSLQESSYTSTDREMQMKEISDLYRNILTEEARQTVLEENKETVPLEEYKQDSAKAGKTLHAALKERLYFRSEGSLVAPAAPETAEEAKRMIRKEFSGLVTEEYLALADEMIDSGSAAGKQDSVPYGEAPQESFDGARRMILSQALGWVANAA